MNVIAHSLFFWLLVDTRAPARFKASAAEYITVTAVLTQSNTGTIHKNNIDRILILNLINHA